ncbi:MAG: hypothetical protein ACHBN1_16460 [Heteroscytonema crispum UTEX LB 1556]
MLIYLCRDVAYYISTAGIQQEFLIDSIFQSESLDHSCDRLKGAFPDRRGNKHRSYFAANS